MPPLPSHTDLQAEFRTGGEIGAAAEAAAPAATEPAAAKIEDRERDRDAAAKVENREPAAGAAARRPRPLRYGVVQTPTPSKNDRIAPRYPRSPTPCGRDGTGRGRRDRVGAAAEAAAPAATEPAAAKIEDRERDRDAAAPPRSRTGSLPPAPPSRRAAAR